VLQRDAGWRGERLPSPDTSEALPGAPWDDGFRHGHPVGAWRLGGPVKTPNAVSDEPGAVHDRPGQSPRHCARRSDRPKQVSEKQWTGAGHSGEASSEPFDGRAAPNPKVPRQTDGHRFKGPDCSSRLTAASGLDPPLPAAHSLGNLTPKNRQDYPRHQCSRNRLWRQRSITRVRFRWARPSRKAVYGLGPPQR
jgi:hypothetical protein